jgi:hypothetical protein
MLIIFGSNNFEPETIFRPSWLRIFVIILNTPELKVTAFKEAMAVISEPPTCSALLIIFPSH